MRTLIRTAVTVATLAGLAAPALRADLSVTPYTTALELAQALIQTPTITINSASYTGASIASGFFTGGLSAGLTFDSGILLTSGEATNVIGPNTSTGASYSNGGGATPNITNGIDGCTLNIVFTPTSDVISFQYIFGSEEYNEWVGSSYNDAFKFVLNGTNIALIPGTNSAVEINSVNLGSNASYFFDNTSGTKNTQLDGLVGTNSGCWLYASGLVNPGVQNVISIEIADRGDSALDSAVFLAGGSFKDELPPDGAVPEPSTYGLAGTALLLLLGLIRRLRR